METGEEMRTKKKRGGRRHRKDKDEARDEGDDREMTEGEQADQLLHRTSGSGPYQTPNAHLHMGSIVTVGVVGLAAFFSNIALEIRHGVVNVTQEATHRSV